MNSYQLRDILWADKHTSKFCPSVKPLNHYIDSVIVRPSITILNYDPCDKPGSHWVCVYVSIDGNIEFFDSYGMESMNKALQEKLLGADKMLIHNRIQLQGFSTVCGQYCLAYALLRTRGYTMHEIVDIFQMTDSIIERDNIVNMLINEMYSKQLLKPLHVIDEGFF